MGFLGAGAALMRGYEGRLGEFAVSLDFWLWPEAAQFHVGSNVSYRGEKMG
jgi:hypothetical protein